MSLDDKKLVEQAKNDPGQFITLYDRYFDAIYRYVMRRVNCKDSAHDIVSQTFYDALAHLKSYEFRGFPFSAWLYKIAHNNVLRWYKEQSRKPVSDIESGKNHADCNADHTNDLKKKEDALAIHEVLERLDFEEREIIRLKFFEEVSNVEIAEIMGLSANHIGVKVFRALKKVKSLLNNK